MRSNGKVKNKTMSTTLSFIWTLLIKQQSSILGCFYGLKVKNSLFQHNISKRFYENHKNG